MQTRTRKNPGQDDDDLPISLFAGKGVTIAQVWMANDLLSRALRWRGPLKGRGRAARIGGIVTAVKAGRVGNAGWGRRMRATKAGKARAKVGPSLAVLGQRGVARRKELAEEREARTLSYGERLHEVRRKA